MYLSLRRRITVIALTLWNHLRLITSVVLGVTSQMIGTLSYTNILNGLNSNLPPRCKSNFGISVKKNWTNVELGLMYTHHVNGRIVFEHTC